MRLTIVILLGTLLQVSASTFAQKVTLSERNASLEALFSEIGKQTGYGFIYTNEVLKNSHRVDIEVKEVPLEDVLKTISKNQPFEFDIQKTTVIVKLKDESDLFDKVTKFLISDINVTGKVTDSLGNPLAGASIKVKGSKLSTNTDLQGIFNLNGVEKGSILVISYLGYEPREVKAVPIFLKPIVLKIATSALDEIQVVAYGVTTKRFNTGNVTTIKSEDIERQPVMNPLQALQGLVPGMEVQMISGYASAPIRVVIRGKNSLDPNALVEPLYVIDGVPQTTLGDISVDGVSTGVTHKVNVTGGQSVLFNINPENIESISVLKDGDATAIYGSRGANGVVLITTKKGMAGPTQLSLNLTQGFESVPRYPEMLSLQQYLSMRREAFKNDVITPTIDNAPDLMLWDTTRSTDWARELVSNGHNTAVNASLSGGSARTSFRLSGSYADKADLNTQSGGYTVATAALNTNHRSADQKFDLNVSAGYSYSIVDVIQASDASTLPPNAPSIYNAAGNLNYEEWEQIKGAAYPFEYLLKPSIQNTQTLDGSMTVGYVIAKGLRVSGNGLFKSSNNTNDSFYPIAAQNPATNPSGSASFGSTKVINIGFEPQISYERVFGKGRFSTFIGGSIQNARTSGFDANGAGYTNDNLLKSINHAGTVSMNDTYIEYKYAAVFGRISYNWDSKYILNINGRRDGSSRFAPGKQYGNFGSVGLAWIASDEQWIQNALPNWVYFVKFRGSYGLTGSDAVGDYQYLPRYNTSDDSGVPFYQYDGIQPYVSIIASNQQYQWESKKSIEGAMELGFLKDRINLDVSWYRNRSSNQLTKIPTPHYTGFSKVVTNWEATVQNSGLEAAVTAKLIQHRDLRIGLRFNISKNMNKLVAYPGIEQSPYAKRYKVGSSLNTQYYLNLLGVDPRSGFYVFEDFNKDGYVVFSDSVFPGTENDDRYNAYDLNSRFYGGGSMDFNYKNFGLILSFTYTNKLGDHPFYGVKLGSMKNFIVPSEMLEDHWERPGDQAKYDRYSTGTTRGVVIGGGDPISPVDASFIRLNNASFSYSLSRDIAKKIGMGSAVFSIRAQNLWTITAYDYDPEVQKGIFKPLPRTVVGNLSFTF